MIQATAGGGARGASIPRGCCGPRRSRSVDPHQEAPRPTIDDLPRLVEEARAAGAKVVPGPRPRPEAAVPATLGQHPARIGGCLTNAHKHAPGHRCGLALGSPGAELVSPSNRPCPVCRASPSRDPGLGLVGVARSSVASGHGRTRDSGYLVVVRRRGRSRFRVNENPIRVVLVDDALVRTGLRMMLAGDPALGGGRWEYVDRDRAIAQIRQHRPDVRADGYRMPRQTGSRRPSRSWPGRASADHRLTTFVPTTWCWRRCAEPVAFLLKGHPTRVQVVKGRFRRVHAGEPILSPSVTRRLIGAVATREAPTTRHSGQRHSSRP